MYKRITMPVNLNFKLNSDYFCHVVGVSGSSQANYYNIGEVYAVEVSGIPRTKRIECVFLKAVDSVNDFYALLSHAKTGKELMAEINKDFQREYYYIMLFNTLK